MPGVSNIFIAKQQGLALLVLVIAIAFSLSVLYMSGFSIDEIKQDRDVQTRNALKKAKEAVIAYAVTYVDRQGNGGEYGLLPCPDDTAAGTEGNMTPNCGNQKISDLGFFPWKSLDMEPLKDSSGTCLLYAVSSSYKVGSTVRSDMINEDSTGMFQVVDDVGAVVVGNSPDDRPVAIVFAPGVALSGQARAFAANSICGQDYTNYDAYLDNNNGVLSSALDDVDKFIHATATSGSQPVSTTIPLYNDKFITINRDEIWRAIVNRDDWLIKMENLAHALALCLAAYANLNDNDGRRLPWPVKTNLDGQDYRVNDNYNDDKDASQGYAGRFPFNVGDSNDAINAGKLTVDELFDIGDICKNLNIGAGPNIDLKTSLSEYRKLWNNWKDHFFYILSKDYEPGSGSEQACDGTGCVKVTVSGITAEHAGVVIFSGGRRDGVSRNIKSVVADYLENGNDIVLDAGTGSGEYTYPAPVNAEDDIMYCIFDNAGLDDDDDLTVAECP